MGSSDLLWLTGRASGSVAKYFDQAAKVLHVPVSGSVYSVSHRSVRRRWASVGSAPMASTTSAGYCRMRVEPQAERSIPGFSRMMFQAQSFSSAIKSGAASSPNASSMVLRLSMSVVMELMLEDFPVIEALLLCLVESLLKFVEAVRVVEVGDGCPVGVVDSLLLPVGEVEFHFGVEFVPVLLKKEYGVGLDLV